MSVMEVGIVREKEPCSKCNAPRDTIFVPANEIEYTSIVKRPRRSDDTIEKVIEQTLSVTLCLRCDGGVEWLC
jgi:hypothetical protein